MILINILLLSVTVSCCLGDKEFPSSFLFGAAGASYQIEGGWNEDGKGLNMWDEFAHVPGHVKNNDTGDVACDSYHKYKEDVELLKQLGAQAYRFSISWSRILPNATNQVNQAGIDYYLNLIKELKDNDIEPVVTLYHWDLPQYLAYLGGWLNPETANHFADFAKICFKNFGEHVKYWVTLNEPSSTCTDGYDIGNHAPGLKLPGEGLYQCTYVHLLAHAKAYRVYDELFREKQEGKISINVNCPATYAKSDDPLDIEAQERYFKFGCDFYLHPIYKGNWPQIVIDRVANRSKLEGYTYSRLPEFTQAEINLIKGTHDFFSLNMYTSRIAEYTEDYPIGIPSDTADQSVTVSVNSSWPQSVAVWLVSDPFGIRFLLNKLHKEYNTTEILITENGWGDAGELEDQGRIDYLRGYLSNVLDAIIEDGINVVGYTHWSLLDNFEWAEGYTQKFGIVKVDFNDPNRTRTPKSSFEWYRKVIAARKIVD